MSQNLEMIIAEEDEFYEPSDEELREHWSGEGYLEFTVISHTKGKGYIPFEIDYHDYSGCVGGLDETLGIEYAVNEGILDVGKLHLGVTYVVRGITVDWTRGDGWEIDDDVDYYVESVSKEVYPHRFISAWWWHLIGWRIRQWRQK